MIKWKIEDYYGKVHTIIIKDCATYSEAYILEWDKKKYRRTIYFDPISNTPKLYSAPSCTFFRKKVAAVELMNNSTILQQTEAFYSEVKTSVTKIKNNKENINDFMDPPPLQLQNRTYQ